MGGSRKGRKGPLDTFTMLFIEHLLCRYQALDVCPVEKETNDKLFQEIVPYTIWSLQFM